MKTNDQPNLPSHGTRLAYRLLHIAAISGFFAAAGWFYFEYFEPKSAHLTFNQYYFLLASLTAGIGFIVQSAVFRRFAVSHSVELGFMESCSLAFANAFLNYLPAKAGLLARGAYLKAVHRLSLTSYTVLLARTQGALLLAAAFIGFIGLSLTLPHPETGMTLVAVTLGIIALIGAAATFPPVYRFLASVLPRRLVDWLGTTEIKSGDNGPAPSAWTFGLASAVTLIGGVRLILISESLQAGLDPASALIMQSVIVAGTLISVMPANLGIREALLIAIAALAGLDIETATALAIVDRLTIMALLLISGPTSALFLLHSLRRHRRKTSHR